MGSVARQTARVIERVQTDEDVLAVILYGSHAREEAASSSDVDLCLILRPGKDTRGDQTRVQAAYLEFSGDRLDIRVFQQLPLYIRRRVLREGRVLFCRDEDALYALSYWTAQQFEDFKPIYYAYLAEVARAGS